MANGTIQSLKNPIGPYAVSLAVFFSYLLVESGSLIEADNALFRYVAQHTAY